jgi:hypothetical protein
MPLPAWLFLFADVLQAYYKLNDRFLFSYTKPTFAAVELRYRMHQIIASYLFQYKTCPLPGLGTLSIQPGAAQADFLNTSMLPPVPAIVFDNKETEADGLLDHIAAKTNTTIYQAIETLGQFANQLKATIHSGMPAILNGLGSFSTNGTGNIVFEQEPLQQDFLQPVKAERVIHPEAEHPILVGDKETTNTEMAEYFNEAPAAKSRWWIWAIILTVLGILALLLYFNGTGALSRFGNAMSIQ